MNRLFDDTMSGWRLAPFNGNGDGFGWPSVEVSETDREVKVTAELAGLEEKDIDIRVDEDMLTISGEKRAESEDKERQYSERYYGRFERSLTLPAIVDEERAKATFKNGVLTITMPKVEGAKSKTKRIPIATA
ncbi:MAG: Hsp20/alpha crystallin family protein [Hyphomonadaceae bacterium]|nr:Hsp20/alpha crystallin family protein [Hyphomonadaceae bacterium]